jgi:hypothetical protein
LPTNCTSHAMLCDMSLHEKSIYRG